LVLDGPTVKPASYLSLQKDAPQHVILSAAGAKDLLFKSFATRAFRALSKSKADPSLRARSARFPRAKQILRYARVPRASLRMTGLLALVRKEEEERKRAMPAKK